MNHHPQQKPDCTGELNVSPHWCGPRLLWKEKGWGWSCPYCKVYGKIEEDGAMMLEGKEEAE